MAPKGSFKYTATKEYYLTYCKCISAARKRALLHYADIANIIGIPISHFSYMSSEIGRILGEISINENLNNRPMLSAVVIGKEKKKPGKGFFILAKQLCKLNYNATEKKETDFWKKELNDVYSTWK